MESAEQRPYLMSFGTGGLFINESVAVSRLHVPGADWDSTLVAAQENGAFPVRKASSARRSIREIVNRLKRLSPDELALFKEGARSEQAALLWLAACRAYRFIGEFAVEVLSDRFLSLRTDLIPAKCFSLSVTIVQPLDSATAAMIMSKALRGRPAAVPSAISLAQTRPAFSSKGRTRPAKRADGPSGPVNHASS